MPKTCSNCEEEMTLSLSYKTVSSIMDIHDGQLYKPVNKLHPKTCVYIISTARAPHPSCTKKGFWPLQIVLIFFYGKTRFKTVVLVGLMVLDHEPKLD